ncbi:MAG: alpha/beta hydrolase [Geobacteraceae bacterium]
MQNFTPGTRYYYGQDNYINFEKHSSGAVNLVFLHGFAASLQTWTDVLRFFPRDAFNIYLVDLKGFGFSSVPRDGDYSIKANAAIVSGFIRDNRIANPIIVGHSFGGGVALLTTMLLAGDKDYYPRGLILIDAAAYKIDLPFFVSYMRMPLLNHLILGLTTAAYKAKYTLERIYYDKSKITADKIDRYAYFMQGPSYGYALIETASDVIPADFELYTSKYRDIRLPSLIIWGENDRVIPLSNGHKLHTALADSRLEVVQGCGHNVQEEMPEKAADLMLTFVQSLRR